MPIELDLTPKPVRRQLFPSPDRMPVRSDPGPRMEGVLAQSSLPAFVRRSPRLNKTVDVFAVPAAAAQLLVDGKENVTPAPIMDDGLADLFEEAPADVELLPPMTPTPKRRSERILLKTPSKTPQRQFGAQLSPNVEHLPHFRTPKYKHDQHPALTALLGSTQKNTLDMTPITRSIHDAFTGDQPLELDFIQQEKILLRNGGTKETGKKSSGLDFPDLPSLKNSSPMSGNPLMNFTFSEMTTDQLTSDMIDPFANNAIPPSSPPGGLFGYLDNAAMDESVNAMWDSLLDSDAIAPAGHSVYPDPEGSVPGAHTLRRSPRRQKAT